MSPCNRQWAFQLSLQDSLLLDNVSRFHLLQPRVGATRSALQVVVGRVTSHLADYTAVTPVGDAAVTATATRNGVFVANVAAGFDDTKHKISHISQLIEDAKGREKYDRHGHGLLHSTIFIRVHHVMRDKRERVVDANKRDTGDQHDFEGSNAFRTSVYGSAKPVQAHTGHDLAQSNRGEPEGKAAHGMATSKSAAIGAPITPGSHGDVHLTRAIGGVFGLVNRELGDAAELIPLLDATCRLKLYKKQARSIRDLRDKATYSKRVCG